MKYCSKCGNELVDEAVICTKCGCSVSIEHQGVQEEKNLVGKPNRNIQLLIKIFNFAFDLFAILSVASLAIAIAMPYIYSHAYTYSTIYYDTAVGVTVNTYFQYNGIWRIVAMVGSFFVVALGCTSFILSLVNRSKLENLFLGIKKFVLGIALVLVSIIFVCC